MMASEYTSRYQHIQYQYTNIVVLISYFIVWMDKCVRALRVSEFGNLTGSVSDIPSVVTD